VNDSHALVLSTDALIAALLGALLEIHGYTPFFPADEETPRDSLRRIRPGIVLVDCEQDTACNEAFFGPATMTGARVIMFSASRSRQEVASFAARYGFDWFILPVDVPSFAKVVRGAAT
jgi:DNA-binding response OmpR family regulator